MHDGNSEFFDYNVPANTMRIKHEGWGRSGREDLFSSLLYIHSYCLRHIDEYYKHYNTISSFQNVIRGAGVCNVC